MKNELGEPDASGRRRPQPVEGTEFIIDCDRVLLAIGQGPDLGWLENGAEGIENVVPLSMMRSRNFAKDYGVLMTDGPLAGITARAIVVLDENDKVVHTELVPEIADEPNYEAALAAL